MVQKQFFWRRNSNSKPHLINWNIVFSSKEKGGFGLVELSIEIKLFQANGYEDSHVNQSSLLGHNHQEQIPHWLRRLQLKAHPSFHSTKPLKRNFPNFSSIQPPPQILQVMTATSDSGLTNGQPPVHLLPYSLGSIAFPKKKIHRRLFSSSNWDLHLRRNLKRR